MNRNLADTAALLSDPGRASIVMSLLGGVALPAGQLAMVAGVAPQTASSHLSRLVDGRLLSVEQQGRHRYYRLANPEVADAIEALLAITPAQGKSQIHGNGPPALNPLSYARTCYSHLAGRLAVEIADALQNRGFLLLTGHKLYELTKKGRAWFEGIGIRVSDGQLKHERFARPCLDWTERRHHVAGTLGSAMLLRFRELKWIAPMRGTRAVRITHQGQRKLDELLGISNRLR